MVTVAWLLGSTIVTGAPLAPPVRSPISRAPASCNSIASVSHELRHPASITTAMLAGYAARATGTPGYMAPEQYRPSEELDARTDIWALLPYASPEVAF